MLGSISPGITEDVPLESGHCPGTPVPARASDSEHDPDYNAEDNTFVIGSDIDEMVTACENLMTLTNPFQDRVHSSESTTQPQMIRTAIPPIELSHEIDSAESLGLASRRRDDSPFDLTDLLETPPGQVATQNEERHSCTFQDPQALTATDIEHMDEETREWLVSFVEITEDLNCRESPIPESLPGELPLRELYVDVGDHHPERTSALLRRRIVRRNRQLGFGNELVSALGHEQSNGNNEEFTSEEELTVLRRYYSDSFIIKVIHRSEEDIEADVEEELEAEWWDSFNSKFEEHSDADEEMTETNSDAQPELTEPLSSPSGAIKAASHGDGL